MKILIIEDTPKYREAALHGLMAHAITFADDLESGLEKLMRGGWDLIISDLYLPLNGETPVGELGLLLKVAIERAFTLSEKILHSSSSNTEESLAPLGLKLAALARRQFPYVPLIVFSQGGSHGGTFGKLRYGLNALGYHIENDISLTGHGAGSKANPADWARLVERRSESFNALHSAAREAVPDVFFTLELGDINLALKEIERRILSKRD